jgi:hypothetical protein
MVVAWEGGGGIFLKMVDNFYSKSLGKKFGLTPNVFAIRYPKKILTTFPSIGFGLHTQTTFRI